MTAVGSYELKTRLAHFLKLVEQGQAIDVTRHGHVIARIVPAERKQKMTREEAIEAIRNFKKISLGSSTIAELKHEGHRY